VAITLVGLLLAVAVPGSTRLYQSMQYRAALRDVITMLEKARQEAIDRGRAQDVEFDPAGRQILLNDETLQLPDSFQLVVTTAAEVNRQDAGVIRFYPEGGSTGGDIEIRSPTGRGVRITVDWLMGGVSQAAYDTD